MKLKYDCLEFLEKSNLPWIKYNLQKQKGFESEEQKRGLKKVLLLDAKVSSLAEECLAWPNLPLLRHNDAKHIIHKICLLLDFGLDSSDMVMQKIADRILNNRDENGALLSLINIPKVFGGDNSNRLAWILCDFPILLYALIRMGYEQSEEVKKAAAFLKSLCSDIGWRCIGSVEKFRGPGKKEDHCPYANLISLKAFSLLPQYHDEQFIKNAIDSLIHMWETQGEKKYYMFGIGTDFKKLKYPNLWFEIIHVLRVLSKYEYARKQNAYSMMVDIVINKQQENGGFIPESIYMAYKSWDFGQKKTSSSSLTYAIWEIFNAV